MARLRVRGLHDVHWWDLCHTPMYIRNASNAFWVPMLTYSTFARDGANENWMPITCEFDADFDDPCAESDTNTNGDNGNEFDADTCNGDSKDTTAGSGTGTGSGGEPYISGEPYPNGYDLPDAGHNAFRIVNDDTSSTGLGIVRPDIGELWSYASPGNASSTGKGTYDSPSPPGLAVSSTDAQITEWYMDTENESGCFDMFYSDYGGEGISIDIYCDGDRIATTCGSVSGRGKFPVCVEPNTCDKLLVRVTNPSGLPWTLTPGELDNDGANCAVIGGGLDVVTEGQASPEGTLGNSSTGESREHAGFPSCEDEDWFTDRENYGSPLVPAPCAATMYPQWDNLQGGKYFEYFHFMGHGDGYTLIDFETFDENVIIDVHYCGNRIATTRGTTSRTGRLSVYFDYNGTVPDIVVRVYTKDGGEPPTGWQYTIYCPSTEVEPIGSELNPEGCDDEGMIDASGSDARQVWHQFGEDIPRSVVLLDIASLETTTVEVYDANGSLILNETGQGRRQLGILRTRDTMGSTRDKMLVVVKAGLAVHWEYRMYCPVPIVDIEVDDDCVEAIQRA